MQMSFHEKNVFEYKKHSSDLISDKFFVISSTFQNRSKNVSFQDG